MKQPSPPQPKVRLIHVTTVPMTLLVLFQGQMEYMRQQGLEVIGVSSPGPILQKVAERDRIPVYGVSMVRGISPLADLVALARLWRLFRRFRPAIVHGHTPKAAFLSMLAATLAFVPVRFYSVRGLMIEILKGWRSRLLRMVEWITCRCAHRVLGISFSVASVMVQEGLCPSDKIKVLHKGCSNGVNSERFNRKRVAAEAVDRFRSQSRLPADVPVIGFVGRLVRDKGIHELIAAWNLLRPEFSDLHLLMVGPFETRDAVTLPVAEQIYNDPRIHHIEWLDDVVPAYMVMDLLFLPTYREGFSNVVLEAAAMELPVVATKVTGCVDAVVDGVTGILVPPRDPNALADAIRKLLKDQELRQRIGKAGRERVVRDFKPEDIWEALYQEYVRLLKEKGIPVPPGDVSAFCQ